jgi:hypothetical protein
MRSVSRSQAELQFSPPLQPREMSARALDALRSRAPAVSNRKSTEKGKQHAKRKIDEAPIFACVGFWRDGGGHAASAQTALPAFVSAIGDNTNVVVVENHIVIDRPAKEIFDFVSTPANVDKWFTTSNDVKLSISGALDHPNRVGDQVFENIDFPDGRKLRLVQTTVVCIPGFEWVVTGQPIGSDDKPLPQVLSLAIWAVQSLPGGKSMFSRFFSLVGSEGSVTVSRSKNGALDPVRSQAALERLKKYLEGSQKKN